MNPNVHFVAEEFPERIDAITEHHEPQWGRMSAQHMVEHLGGIFLIAAGQVQVPGLPTDKQKKLYDLLTNGQFKFTPNTKSPVMPEELMPLNFSNLEAAKGALQKAVKKFFLAHENQEDLKVEHPVFGPLTYGEWLEFHEMHVKHHLEQFGLLG